MLEIVVSEVEEFILKKTKLFNDANILGFCIMSSYGNLENLPDMKIKEIGTTKFNVEEDFNNLNQKLQNINSVRIWYSSIDSEDVCNMYYLVNFLSSKNVEINLCDTHDKEHNLLIEYGIDEIKELIKNTRKLNIIEIEEIKNKWDKLFKENGELRILEDGLLKSYKYDYMDNLILRKLSEFETISINSLTGMCIKDGLCGHYRMYFIFENRINNLIKYKKIITKKDELGLPLSPETIITLNTKRA